MMFRSAHFEIFYDICILKIKSILKVIILTLELYLGSSRLDRDLESFPWFRTPKLLHQNTGG
jgi:hypothetical protein